MTFFRFINNVHLLPWHPTHHLLIATCLFLVASGNAASSQPITTLLTNQVSSGVSINGDNYGNVANFKDSPNSHVEQSITIANTKKELRSLLNDINTNIIEMIDLGSNEVDVFINESHLRELNDIASNPDFTNFLLLKRTGVVVNGQYSQELDKFLSDSAPDSAMSKCILFPKESLKIAIQENSLAGYLIPASDPSPPLPDGEPAPTNTLTLYLGNSADIVPGFPHNVIHNVIIYKGQALLTIFKDSQGLRANAKFYGDNGRIVCILKDNHFMVNPSNYLRCDMPDQSTLIVRDINNIEVLSIKYINPYAIRLNCRFRVPNDSDIVISPDEGQFSNSNIMAGDVNDIVIP